MLLLSLETILMAVAMMTGFSRYVLSEVVNGLLLPTLSALCRKVRQT
jgi:hypothetical protein